MNRSPGHRSRSLALTGNYPLTYTGTTPSGGTSAPTTRNVVVTAPPSRSQLGSFVVLAGGAYQFTFTNALPTSFTVLASTNITLPTSNWTALGAAALVSPGVYQFTDTQSTNFPRRFYQVRSP